jgi:tetratricopeptide (TPR) repeat protein
MSRIVKARTLALVLALLAPLALGGCQQCCDELTGAGDVKKDNMARVDYFESAALTYYDGGQYALSAMQWRKVLAIQTENKKAKRGLAKALYMEATAERLSRPQKALALRESQSLFEELVKMPWTRTNAAGVTTDRKFEVQTDLGLVYAELGDLYDRDIRDLNAAIKTDPNADEPALQKSIAAETTRRNVLLNKAIPVFNRVLKASPNNPYALAGLAKVYMQLGNDDQGIYYAKEYLKISQESQIGWKREMDNYEKALKGQMQEEQRRVFVQKIVGAREKEKKTWLMLASVYMRRMEFAQAVNAYSRVIKLDAAVPAAYVERAQAYGALNQYKLAINDLEEYLKITDPQMHRSQRLSAVEMLDRYQAARARQGAMLAEGAGNGTAYGSPN